MKSIFLSVLLLFALSAYTQTPEVSTVKNTSTGNKSLKRSLGTKLVHADANEIITLDLGTVYTNNVLAVYDFETMAMKETFVIKTPKIDGGFAFDSKMVFHKDKISVFYITKDEKTDTRKIHGKIIDRETKKDEVKIKKLFTFNTKTKAKNVSVDFFQSPDKSKILFLGRPYNSYGDFKFVEVGEKLIFSMFDLELNKLTDKELEFPKGFGKVIIHQVLVTNNGGFSLIVSTNYEEKSNREITMPHSQFKIYSSDKNTTGFVQIEDTESGKNIITCSGYVPNDTIGNITFFGLYNEETKSVKGKTPKYKGIYTLVVNSKKWTLNNAFYNGITDKIAKKIENKADNYQGTHSNILEDEKNINNIFVKQVDFNAKGEYTIYAEMQSIKVDLGGPNTGSIIHSYRLQAVVFELDKEGILTNTIVIPKGEKYINLDDVGGFLVCSRGENKGVVFSDSKNNYSTSGAEGSYLLYNFKKSILSYSSFNNKGKVSKQAVSEGGSLSPILNTESACLINGNTYVMLGIVMKWKQYGLVKITF